MRYRKLPFATLALSLTLLAALGWAYARLLPSGSFDPDRWFHIRLAGLMQQGGLLHSLPQVEDLGWGRNFPDKEMLFHVLGALAYAGFGERGVDSLAPLLALAIVLLAAACAARFVGWWRGLLLVAVLMAGNASFVERLTLLRPHLLAISCFLLLAYGLLVENALVIAVGTATFALSYHAFYLPCLLLACYAAAAASARRAWRLPVIAGLTGLLIGILVNPYFPATVVAAWRHVLIAFGYDSVMPGTKGAELSPLRSDIWLKSFAAQLAVALVGVAVVARKCDRPPPHCGEPLAPGPAAGVNGAGLPGAQVWQVAMLTGALLVTLLLSILNPRAAEYAVPLAALTAASLIGLVANQRLWPWAGICLLGLLQMPTTLFIVRHMQSFSDNRVAAFTRILGHIPPGGAAAGTGAKVYNCNWDDAAYIFYTRPDLRFVDMLDPSFLLAVNPALYQARSGLNFGAVPDAYGKLRELFKADYVLCPIESLLTHVMAQDPNFLTVATEMYGSPSYALFALKPQRVAAQVRRFAVAPWSTTAALPTDLRAATGNQVFKPWPGADSPPSSQNLFVDLQKDDMGQDGRHGRSAAHCAVVRIAAAEVARLAGAQAVTIGGGPWVHLYINGRKIYSSGEEVLRPQMTGATLALAAPLAATDEVAAIVCAPAVASYHGVALALWQPADLRALCAEKKGTREFCL